LLPIAIAHNFNSLKLQTDQISSFSILPFLSTNGLCQVQLNANLYIKAHNCVHASEPEGAQLHSGMTNMIQLMRIVEQSGCAL
jgi:hypothetical protein